MAGIGFELRRLLKEKYFVHKVKAYMYGGIVTSGPMLICIFAITVMKVILASFDDSKSDMELFTSSVMYPFIFSSLVTSGFSMVITRYIADLIYQKNYRDILVSLYGAIIVCVSIGAILGIVFFINSPIIIEYKVLSYLLFVLLIIVWLEMVYISALKEYMKIINAFLFGIVMTMIVSVCLVKFLSVPVYFGLLLSLDIGFFIIALVLIIILKRSFEDSNEKYFAFLTYIPKYPQLFLISFLYTLGVYIQNFIFWKSELGQVVSSTYFVSPIYDSATFFAFLTTVPSIVMFMITFETSFYEVYKKFYSYITNGGNLNEILSAKREIISVLSHELSRIMELQLFYSLIFLVIGMKFLPYIGFTGLNINIFCMLIFGCWLCVMMFIVMMVLMYFDDLEDALMVAIVFCFSNVILTVVTVFAGSDYYGVGFFVASLIGLIIAYIKLDSFVNNLEYHTFCSQPLSNVGSSKDEKNDGE